MTSRKVLVAARQCLGLFLVLLGFAIPANALSIDWSGHYRFEYTEINSTSLAEPGNRKAYVLHNLVLSPKIIAADGIEVVSQFSILGNPDYPGTQAGQAFGIGGVPRGTPAAGSNVASRNAGASSFEVRQLYMTINQEYGQILVGRAPIEFGTGMTYDAGNDPFDHWGDTHDMVGYKFLVGNLSFMPMLGKPYDFSVAQGRDVTDVMIDVTYDNPETESTFAVFHSNRTSSGESNDAVNVLGPMTGGTAAGGWNVKNTNILIGRGWEKFKLKIEAGFTDGATGLTFGGEDVKTSGYGIVTEMEFPRPGSAFDWKVRAGIVSGDNPETSNFEGYALNRNYDLAFIMFNHPVGGYDIFRTQFQRQRVISCPVAPCPTIHANEESLDEEAVSNVIFLNPSLNYTINEKWSWRNSIVYAQLQTKSSTLAGNDSSKDLGFEWDTSFTYKPHPRFQWVNQVGLLFPGDAWKEGTVNRDNKFTYGFQSKAAISF